MMRVFLVVLMFVATVLHNPVAQARMISAPEAVHGEQSLSRQLLQQLDTPEAQAAVKKMGVSPEEARARIAGLSDSEIRELAAQHGQPQAGGDAVIGVSLTLILLIVIIVLLLR